MILQRKTNGSKLAETQGTMLQSMQFVHDTIIT